jgi:hypothetical protein
LEQKALPPSLPKQIAREMEGGRDRGRRERTWLGCAGFEVALTEGREERNQGIER